MGVKRDIKGPAPARVRVRVRVRVRLSGILSCLSFPGILSSSIMSSGILSGIRFGLHRGNPRATTSVFICIYTFIKTETYCCNMNLNFYVISEIEKETAKQLEK